MGRLMAVLVAAVLVAVVLVAGVALVAEVAVVALPAPARHPDPDLHPDPDPDPDPDLIHPAPANRATVTTRTDRPADPAIRARAIRRGQIPDTAATTPVVVRAGGGAS